MNPDAPARRRDRATWRDIVVAATLAILVGVAAGYLVADYRSRHESAQQLDACQRAAVAFRDDRPASGPGISTSAVDDMRRCMENFDENFDDGND